MYTIGKPRFWYISIQGSIKELIIEDIFNYFCTKTYYVDNLILESHCRDNYKNIHKIYFGINITKKSYLSTLFIWTYILFSVGPLFDDVSYLLTLFSAL